MGSAPRRCRGYNTQSLCKHLLQRCEIQAGSLLDRSRNEWLHDVHDTTRFHDKRVLHACATMFGRDLVPHRHHWLRLGVRGKSFVRFEGRDVRYRWVSGWGVQEGHVLYFEEYITGKLLKQQVVFTRVIPHQHMEFVPTFWLMKLFLPRMVFRIAPEGDGSRFIAEIHVRMGLLAQRAQRKEMAAVREHMRVEGLNLKRILEQRTPVAPGTDRMLQKRGEA